MCRGFTHGWCRRAPSWGLQVQEVLLWRIHACVIPGAGRSSAEGPSAKRILLARAFLCRWCSANICEGIMLDCAALPPRRYLLVAAAGGAVHLKLPSRSRFSGSLWHADTRKL